MGEATRSDDERLIEQLRATVQMKDHLLQMVSHEMRTPLVSISNFSSAMLNAWELIEDDAKVEYLGIINDQALRLSRLVNDLLAVARMESGRLRTVREEVPLRDVAQQTIAELMPDTEGAIVACDEGVHALADRDHVKQILVNYVSNAVKYGEGPIEIHATQESEEQVRLWVLDHGAGVSPDFEPHLFEKFAQAHPAQQHVGSGLGLAIVEGLASAQGGAAWYERSDEGACFGVTLPSA